MKKTMHEYSFLEIATVILKDCTVNLPSAVEKAFSLKPLSDFVEGKSVPISLAVFPKENPELVTKAILAYAMTDFRTDELVDGYSAWLTTLSLDHVSDLLYFAIIPRIENMPIFRSETDLTKYTDNEYFNDIPSPSITGEYSFQSLATHWVIPLIGWIKRTYFRHAFILDSLENERDNLLGALERTKTHSDAASFESRYSDTPQDSANPTADQYLTNFRKDSSDSSSSESEKWDNAYLSEKLAKAEEAISDELDRWADDYIREFHLMTGGGIKE